MIRQCDIEITTTRIAYIYLEQCCCNLATQIMIDQRGSKIVRMTNSAFESTVTIHAIDTK
jgi:hypothetical protein